MPALLNLLNEAHTRVTKDYPAAEFYEADGTADSSVEPITDQINRWRFVFNDPSTQPNSTVTITYQNGALGDPEHIDQPWLEDRVIPLPVAMDLPAAVGLMQQAGYNDPFSTVTLRYVLAPNVTEPHYIFGLPQRQLWVFVGVNSGQVSTEQAT